MRLILLFAGVLLLSITRAAAFDGPRQSTNVPRFDAAVDKALAYLHGAVEKEEQHAGHEILAAYAMIKCGVPKTDPFVAKAIAAAVGRSNSGQYQPMSAYDHIYGSGVDSMLLVDLDAKELYLPNLQAIANYVQSAQRADGSWSDGPQQPGDVSMSQYGVLALWACQRGGCNVSPAALDRAADFLMKKGNSDGGWGYRPGTTAGPGMGASTHNMTMAGGGAVGICRLLLHGLRNPPKPEKKDEDVLPGGLTKIDPLADAGQFGSSFPDYKPQNSAGALDARVDRAFGWNLANFQPVSRVEHNLYYYYCLERAAAVGDLGKINGEDWFIVYGDGLLTLQAADGSFNTHTGPVVGTCFALLYYMKSTDQILKKMYGLGQQLADRGNPFGDKKKKEPTELDRLIADIANMDFDKLDETPVEVADEIVRSVLSIDDPEKLVGQEDQLKSLMKHPNDKVRSAAVWALGRTGDFKLVPLMLDGIRDTSVDVNIEAIQALRFIARRPQGFGETLAPFAALGTEDQIKIAAPEERLRLATPWREKALKDWSNWYFSVRPFEDRGGLDELQLAVPLGK
ncbi:MAG: HEAT repeat domain-containing protein [Planctomycetaceae bacterium]